MKVSIWFCGEPGDGEPMEMAWGRMISDEQEHTHFLALDMEHERLADPEMMEARAGVDPYAPELAIEEVEPETVDAAVWEGLTR